MNPELRERFEEQTRKLIGALEKSKKFKEQMDEAPPEYSIEELMQSIRDKGVDMTEQEAVKLVKDTKREYDALIAGKESILKTGGKERPSATPLFAFTFGLFVGLWAFAIMEFIIKPLAQLVKGWFLL